MKLSLKATRFVIDALDHYQRHFDQQLLREDLPEDDVADLSNDRAFLEAIKQDLERYRDTLTRQLEDAKAG